MLRSVAVHLDARTGQAQTMWDPVEVADYLRAHQLTVRITGDTITVDGPEAKPDPGIPPTRNVKGNKNATPGTIPKRRITRKNIEPINGPKPRRGLRVRGGT